MDAYLYACATLHVMCGTCTVHACYLLKSECILHLTCIVHATCISQHSYVCFMELNMHVICMS